MFTRQGLLILESDEELRKLQRAHKADPGDDNKKRAFYNAQIRAGKRPTPERKLEILRNRAEKTRRIPPSKGHGVTNALAWSRAYSNAEREEARQKSKTAATPEERAKHAKIAMHMDRAAKLRKAEFKELRPHYRKWRKSQGIDRGVVVPNREISGRGEEPSPRARRLASLMNRASSHADDIRQDQKLGTERKKPPEW